MCRCATYISNVHPDNLLSKKECASEHGEITSASLPLCRIQSSATHHVNRGASVDAGVVPLGRMSARRDGRRVAVDDSLGFFADRLDGACSAGRRHGRAHRILGGGRVACLPGMTRQCDYLPAMRFSIGRIQTHSDVLCTKILTYQ